MIIKECRILTVALSVCVVTGWAGDSSARLSPEQESLKGVKSITVHASCSGDAKEAGLREERIRKDVRKQLETAGVKVMPSQVWGTVPGRCRLRVMAKVYKPPRMETLIYNLKVDFLQTVTLERNPEMKIDATTWELTWFANGSEGSLAEAVAQNLKVLTASFIKDYRAANPKDAGSADADGTDNASASVPKSRNLQKSASVANRHGFVASKASGVFHRPDCRWALNISEENLVSFKSRNEAANSGKRPCKTCNP
ncbi:MAG: Ada metal-binding domain-containing protein [Planctomycetota bacterium]|jgi:hypothetical protein